LNTPTIDIPLWYWLAFGAFVVAMLVLDLGVFHRNSRETTLREAALWTCIWVALAMAFNLLVWLVGGGGPAVQFLTGYLIEWSLSMDNVFVFAVIFNYFKVPLKYQYRVLFWGILGAVVMRLTFILVGAEAIERWDWVMYIFGAFLVYTGIKLAFHEDEYDPEKSIILRLARRWFPVAHEGHGDRFFVREEGRRCMTPLFLVLLVVDFADIMFAVDSVPAIFSVTQDRFIVFTSNTFAILGLRALYFLLAGVMDMFRYLRFGLSAILVFVGLKMLLHWLRDPPEWYLNRFGEPAPWARHWLGDPPSWAMLPVIVGLLGIAIGASIVSSRREQAAANRNMDGGSRPTEGGNV
jgi:TerC family integral membrane protein